MVIDPPGASTQGDLKDGVKVQDDNDGNEEFEGEGVVSEGFVRFVEGVGSSEFRLVVDKPQLLETV